jgi:hypothetical protein
MLYDLERKLVVVLEQAACEVAVLLELGLEEPAKCAPKQLQ